MKNFSRSAIGVLFFLSSLAGAATLDRATFTGVVFDLTPDTVILAKDGAHYEVPLKSISYTEKVKKGKIVTSYLTWDQFQRLKPVK